MYLLFYLKGMSVTQGLEPKKHFACVTGKGSPMDNPAEYLEVPPPPHSELQEYFVSGPWVNHPYDHTVGRP